MARDDKFLMRTNPDGSRQASWRIWVLIWVTPVLFAAATLLLSGMVLYRQVAMEVTEGVVTHVYDWENDAPEIFYPGDRVYSPRFRYTWSDGEETEATGGTSHTAWNFEIGSVHQIRFWPDEKADVVLVSPQEWWIPRAIAIMTILTATPALLLTFLLRRWLRRGAKSGVQHGTIRRM